MLVTGGTTGIGKETARALLAAGASVVITARSDDKGAAAVDDLRVAVPDAEVAFAVLELGSLASVRDVHRPVPRGRTTGSTCCIANAGVMAMPYGQTERRLRAAPRHQPPRPLRAHRPADAAAGGERAVAGRHPELGWAPRRRTSAGTTPTSSAPSSPRWTPTGSRRPRTSSTRWSWSGGTGRSACTRTRCTPGWCAPTSAGTSPRRTSRTSWPGPRSRRRSRARAAACRRWSTSRWARRRRCGRRSPRPTPTAAATAPTARSCPRPLRHRPRRGPPPLDPQRDPHRRDLPHPLTSRCAPRPGWSCQRKSATRAAVSGMG